MPDLLWELIVVIIVGVFLLFWLISAIYNNVRHQMLQILAFMVLLFGYAFPVGEYPAGEITYKIASSLAILSSFIALLGVLMAGRRWVIRRGTKDLTKFSNLGIYAYVRYPVTYAMIILAVAIGFFRHAILSNVLCFIAIILFIVSSYEKDQYYRGVFGYPFHYYTLKVPRFFIIYGIIKALREPSRKTR